MWLGRHEFPNDVFHMAIDLYQVLNPYLARFANSEATLLTNQ